MQFKMFSLHKLCTPMQVVYTNASYCLPPLTHNFRLVPSTSVRGYLNCTPKSLTMSIYGLTLQRMHTPSVYICMYMYTYGMCVFSISIFLRVMQYMY